MISQDPDDADRGLGELLAQVRQCTLCAAELPLGPRPLLQLAPAARILIVGQAPGRRAHESGLPFNDPSGDRLRSWLGIEREVFYDARQIALLPMGLCYPGTGKSGDLPPRPECAPAWRAPLLARLARVELTLLIGQYALAAHLPGATLTERVAGWREHWPRTLPLPHPSPRNQAWIKRHPWFEAELLPALRRRVAEVLGAQP